MDPNVEETNTKKISSNSAEVSHDDVTKSPPNSSAMASAIEEEKPETPIETEKRAVDHDSLVTVRLSEPPSLYINTAIPPSLLPSRKTVYGIEYTPTEVMTKSVEEEPESDQEQEPDAPALNQGTSLQEELKQLPSGGEDMEDEGAEGRTSSDSETVDWEQLQKTEDLESKDQGSDNVSLVCSVTLSLIY